MRNSINVVIVVAALALSTDESWGAPIDEFLRHADADIGYGFIRTPRRGAVRSAAIVVDPQGLPIVSFDRDVDVGRYLVFAGGTILAGHYVDLSLGLLGADGPKGIELGIGIKLASTSLAGRRLGIVVGAIRTVVVMPADGLVDHTPVMAGQPLTSTEHAWAPLVGICLSL